MKIARLVVVLLLSSTFFEGETNDLLILTGLVRLLAAQKNASWAEAWRGGSQRGQAGAASGRGQQNRAGFVAIVASASDRRSD